MYRSAGHNHESKTYLSGLSSRVLSPRITSYRPSPRLIDSISSPYKTSREFESLSISETINQIESLLKKVSPYFSFSYTSDPPLQQAVNFFSQAVDCILAENSKISKFSPDSQEKYEINGETEKAIETKKNLNRYEHLLKKKEAKLEEEKIKLKLEKNHFKEIEENFRKIVTKFEIQEKSWNETRKYEFERIQSDKADAEKKIAEAKDFKERIEKKVDETTNHLKLEKEGLLQLEQCLNQTKANLASEQKKITQEKLEIEKEKWELDQRKRKLEESEALLKVKIDHFYEEKQVLNTEKSKLNDWKKGLKDDKIEFLSNCGSKLSSRKSPEDLFVSDKQELATYRSSNQEVDAKGLELDEREQEIEQAYIELQEQMDNFNKELEEREIILDDRELSIETKEKEIKKKLENIASIETSLIESKMHVEELRTTTIPELEKQSELLQSLIAYNSEKKTELEAVFDRLLKNISVFENSKNELDVIEESLSQSISSTSPTSARHRIDVDDLTKELEYKLAKLKAWEEELETTKVSLDKQKEEIKVAAEFLKKAFLDLEEKKKMYEKEISDEKEKLKTQFLKLDSGMRLLETKESEVFSYKKKLLERNQMLNIKENEIQKLLQKNGFSSPFNEEKN